MDRETFNEELNDSNTILNKDELKSIIRSSLSDEQEGMFKGYKNLIIVMEEFAECSKEVSKVLRNKEDKISLLEETADALLSIYYIQEICNISDEDLVRAVNVKLKRQNKRNEENKINIEKWTRSKHKFICNGEVLP